MPQAKQIQPLVEKVLARLGLELYEIKYAGTGPKSVLRLFIDKQGGVTIDDCENASREISTLLDVEDFSKSPYRLEVSSPGIDRELLTEKDYRRVVGEKLHIQVREDNEKTSTVSGELVSCEDGAVTVRTKKETVTLPVDRLVRGKIEISF